MVAVVAAQIMVQLIAAPGVHKFDLISIVLQRRDDCVIEHDCAIRVNRIAWYWTAAPLWVCNASFRLAGIPGRTRQPRHARYFRNGMTGLDKHLSHFESPSQTRFVFFRSSLRIWFSSLASSSSLRSFRSSALDPR